MENTRGSSISRVLEIIEAVAQADRPISPQDLIQDLAIPKPSLHRLLHLLAEEQFIQYDLNGGVVPGIRSIRLSIDIWYSRNFKQQREAILSALSTKIGETCGISVPNGNQMTYTDRVQSNWPLQIYLPVGTQVPFYCTAGGKLYLGSLPPSQRIRLLDKLSLVPLSKNTLVDKTQLLKEVERTEQSGIGVDNEEFIAGLVGCAVPIYDGEQRFMAALILHAPTLRHDLDSLLRFVPEMRATAQEISTLF